MPRKARKYNTFFAKTKTQQKKWMKIISPYLIIIFLIMQLSFKTSVSYSVLKYPEKDPLF